MTLQEHYNAIKNGQGNKDQFLKQAKHLFPNYFNQYTDFNTAANVLKSKQIINESIGGVVSKGFDIFNWKNILAEEVKAEEKKVSKEVEDYNKSNYDNKDMKNADNINFNEIMKGFYAELKDPKNHDKTSEEIKAVVVKNLAKDCLYYTKNGEFGVKGIGYTTEAPGLGEPKPAKGPHKSSGYGDLDIDKKVEKVKANVQDSLGDKEAKTSMPKKVKEMDVTPQNSKGVKKMDMPGKEKKIKLKENKDKWNSLSDDEKMDLLLTVVKDPDEAEKLLDKDYSSLPNEVTANMEVKEQKLRSIIRNVINEELNEYDIEDWNDQTGDYDEANLNEKLSENYETKKDLAQLQKDAQNIEPKAQKIAQAFKTKGITDATEIIKYLKKKDITDSDIITRVIDLAAKK